MARDAYRPKMVNGKRVASPEYRSWQMMKERVKTPEKHGYKYPIGMDPRWQSFDAFIADMGAKPAVGHTLDRKDGSKGYWPSNCRWAARTTQARNRPYCKFTMELAEEVRALYAEGRLTQKQIAAQYGSTQAHISQIVREAAWRKEVA